MPGHNALTAAAAQSVHSAAASAAANAAAAAVLAQAAAKKAQAAPPPPKPRPETQGAASTMPKESGHDGVSVMASPAENVGSAPLAADPGGVEMLKALFPNTRISVQTAPPPAPAGMPAMPGMLGAGARSAPSAPDPRNALLTGGRGALPSGPGGISAALGALGAPLPPGAALGSPGLLGAFGPQFSPPGAGGLGSLGGGISESLAGQNKQSSWMPSLRETPPVEEILAGFHQNAGGPPRGTPDPAFQGHPHSTSRRQTPAGAAPGLSSGAAAPPQVNIGGGGEKGGTGRHSRGGQEKRSSNQRRNRG